MRRQAERRGTESRFEDVASHRKWKSSLLPKLLHVPGLHKLSWSSRTVTTK